MWIKIQLENKRCKGIPFPIPLYLFQELLNSIVDILTVACFFVPKQSDLSSSTRISIYSVKALVIEVMKLLDSINEDAPYDLVDVTTNKVKVSIKIR